VDAHRAPVRRPVAPAGEARWRTSSPANPEECLSRQELAELANAWIWEHHNKKLELTANYIGKLEQGVIRWPSAPCREAFRAIFNVPKDSALGFVNARARSCRAVVKLNDVDDVKRRKLIETTTFGVSGLVYRLHPELYSAVGDLAHVAAYMAHDADAQEEVRRLYGFALSWAEQAAEQAKD
jgi:hypothetical protein